MGKTTRWIRSLLTGGKKKKHKTDNDAKISPNETQSSYPIVAENYITPIMTNPREKRRWSFRRSEAAPKNLISMNPSFLALPDNSVSFDAEIEHTKHAIAVTATTIVKLSSEEQLAAVIIQTLFRSYLARKALRALRGLVKLQALVRGHLVRLRATTTLRRLQALLSVQDRARVQRIRMVQQVNPNPSVTNQHHQIQIQKHFSHRRTTYEARSKHPYHDRDRGIDDENNVKIVEMDICQPSKNRYLNKANTDSQLSPAPSDFTEVSRRTYDNHQTNESCFFSKSPQLKSRSAISHPDQTKLRSALDDAPSLSYDDYMSLHIPSYMANTQSSRAKARSQSAPRTRSGDSLERQCSRRKASVDHGRNIPIWMQQRPSSSSTHVDSSPAASVPSYQFLFPVGGGGSVKESECGSNSTLLTNPNCCKGLVDFEFSDESLFSVITPTRA